MKFITSHLAQPKKSVPEGYPKNQLREEVKKAMAIIGVPGDNLKSVQLRSTETEFRTPGNIGYVNSITE